MVTWLCHLILVGDWLGVKLSLMMDPVFSHWCRILGIPAGWLVTWFCLVVESRIDLESARAQLQTPYLAVDPF